MFPGYADAYFTGGKCEAYGGEAQVTDAVCMNSPAPRTLILRHPVSLSTWESRAGPDWCELDLRLETALPPPQEHFFFFSVAPFEEVPVLIPRPGGLPHPTDPQAQGSGHKHHTLSTSRMRSGHQA